MLDSTSAISGTFTSGILWEMMLWPVLFDVFINGLDDGTECTVTKFAGDIKVKEVLDITTYACHHSDNIDGLEKHAERNLIKFS